MFQRDYATLMINSCYVMSIARGMQVGFLGLLEKGLNERSVLSDGFVRDAAKLSGLKVMKATCFAEVIPNNEFVVAEINGGEHFCLLLEEVDRNTIGTDIAELNHFNPSDTYVSGRVTSLRVFFK